MASIYDEMIKKTKEIIQTSFLLLLKEKDFLKISVQDITKTANINRGTFYLHYQDKYDLINQMEENLLAGLEKHLGHLKPELSLIKAAEEGQISTHAVEVFRYIQMNADIFKVFLGGNNHLGFHKRFKNFFMNHFIEKTMENEETFRAITIPRNYLSSFATSAFLGLIEQWLENDLAESPSEMAEIYIQIIFFIRRL